MNKKRSEAERAAEWFAREILGCVDTRRAVRTKWQKVDFFGADVVGKRPDGSHVYIQVTTGQAPAVSVRKRKLEKYHWHKSDRVLLLQLKYKQEGRKKKWYFDMYELEGGRKKADWQKHEASAVLEIPRQWFTAYKEGKGA